MALCDECRRPGVDDAKRWDEYGSFGPYCDPCGARFIRGELPWQVALREKNAKVIEAAKSQDIDAIRKELAERAKAAYAAMLEERNRR